MALRVDSKREVCYLYRVWWWQHRKDVQKPRDFELTDVIIPVPHSSIPRIPSSCAFQDAVARKVRVEVSTA